MCVAQLSASKKHTGIPSRKGSQIFRTHKLLPSLLIMIKLSAFKKAYSSHVALLTIVFKTPEHSKVAAILRGWRQENNPSYANSSSTYPHPRQVKDLKHDRATSPPPPGLCVRDRTLDQSMAETFVSMYLNMTQVHSMYYCTAHTTVYTFG